MRLYGPDKGVFIVFVRGRCAQKEKALCAERTKDWTEKFGSLGITCTCYRSDAIFATLISLRLRVDWRHRPV
jgi:hypothetical protein